MEDIGNKAPVNRLSGHLEEVFSLQTTGGVNRGEDAHRGTFDISFHPGQLAGDENVRQDFQGEVILQNKGGIDVRIAVHEPVA